ncbi:ankyrin repeat domain-containing protein 11-like [Haliotis rubra]|uniref:ankyrin repeat domain-containing protein 11-like n=1 Tax=Haliotis rubra TaxID=36100 RepID=UPI001EE54350|nr:ankyrin repeat domain-containing protein 11-like [Haliotis rubra]XP_046575492.1 ankyrin repeat domain-containing protein 11-like [Haliotis rubra]
MPGLRYKILCMPDMSEKKSPPRKEKSQYVKTPQSDGKGMKRKLMVTDATPEDDEKRITSKRKRALLIPDSSPEPGNMPTPRTPGGNISRITVPLSERQQMALLMRMTDGASQGESSPKPSSPTTPVSSSKRTPIDKKVNKRNDRGETALHTAAKRGDVKQTKRLIKAGANVNVKDYAGWTPLHEACNQGMLSVAKQLLKAGANVNVQGFDDDTPLHDAAVNGHPKLVELLLKHGANPLQANNKGKTALDVAASAEIEQVLRKEIISSSSDSSSIDDARSPTSPESTSSNKDEDSRPEDIQDLELHGDIGAIGSSSSTRRTLIPALPKSPEKTGSPRLCLKFQPTKPQYKGLPRHQSYSLTVVTNDQNSSPPGSPVSSIDSDLYDPHLEPTLIRKEAVTDETAAATSWLKMDENTEKGAGVEEDNRYKLRSQETQAFSPHRDFEDISDGEEEEEDQIQNTVGKNNQVENNQHIPQDSGDPGDSRLSSDSTSQNIQPPSSSSSGVGGANNLFPSSSVSSVSSSVDRTPSHAHHNSQRRGSLGSNTLSDSVGMHKPLTRWQLQSSPNRDDGDVSVSQSNKFKVLDGSETNSAMREKDNVSPKVDQESLPGSPRPRLDSRESRPLSPRTRSEHDSRPLSPKSRQDRPNSPKTRSESRESRPVSPKLRSDRESRDSRPSSPKTRSELRDSKESRPSSPKTRSELRDSKDGRPNSPRPKSEKGSRSSSPKVPPLKIIIPQKTAPSSSMDENCLKLLLTKPALPYVLNPTQEKEAEAVLTEMCQPSHNTSRASSPASSRPSSRASAAPSEEGKREKLFREAAPKPQIDDTVKEDSRDGKDSKEEKYEVKEEVEKEEAKEEKEERRITRTLRSHTAMLQQQQQQQQQQKQDKTEKGDKQEKNGGPEPVPTNNSQHDNGSSIRSQRGEEIDYMNIHPRKRKLRPKPDTQQLGEAQLSAPIPIPPPATSYEKPPNPFELYLNIRKQIASKQQSLSAVHPKAPSGFKDYLMVNCTYVLQGNATSTLSVPMLSPPQSVEGPMRELFQEQEKARYNLRLQHLIEREKLMLSIEQEILREHGRAARALANQSLPLSVCTILKDEEIYNMQELEQAEDKHVRSRYNGRQFISWIQDVGDKYDKIKEFLLMRHHHEAESLFAVQKMDWEWRLKACGLCDYNTTPVIDDLHVPMVHVNDEFELLPT